MNNSAYQTLGFESIAEGIYLLTLNRPASLNALNSETFTELAHALEQVAGNDEARVLLITGAGEKAFVAGADISEMQMMTAVEAMALSQAALKVFRQLELLPIPVIALVNGYCLGGGCELALACDWIIASENAVFGQPEVNLGITPGFGGTQRLSRLIGPARAMEMIVSGRHVKAVEALSWGLVNHVYPQDRLMQEALSMAELICQKGPLAVHLSKQAIVRGRDLELDSACQIESQAFGLCFSSDDQKEGMTAFLEKRKPVFKGV
ncbi:MAG: enoyl-CoA hydratase/isomerase family protein [Candidatus Thiodiazotropha sp. (ex Ctena orbiculata)]|nr:enoyl-CoA hydratase/isomerase family protein [Candidatus Thiodiazotropha taylori]MBT3036859.1 enoyl-CoA hydratase/isomerase family protein [Candidatus Thiodiazotropha taylori]